MAAEQESGRRGRALLVLSALGVVFGDIGTSPLYALKECVDPEHGFVRTREDLLGVLSLIVWSLGIVVTGKYLLLVMRAHNGGQGGIFALLALMPERLRTPDGVRIGPVAFVALLGAALLCGEGVITPAISVLSAVEGLEVATAGFEPYVVPITCALLVALFALQHRGTGAVGRLFGPVMLVWFATLAVLGVWHVSHHPDILSALSPHHALLFFATHGWDGVWVLGSVVLVITGVEALYADMGHFGVRPIRRGWLAIVWPSLVLAYFGQGALLLSHPEEVGNPFFGMVPRGAWTVALVVLSGAATVIASQALITGAFSLIQQAVQLGYFPRVAIRHTTYGVRGQIYVPAVNWGLALGSIALVLAMRESSQLAAAYGVAVTGTMVITSIAFCAVARTRWRWSARSAFGVLALMLALDLPFLAANLAKFEDGGFVPVLIAAVLLAAMLIWWKGHALVTAYRRRCPSLGQFLASLEQRVCTRVPGSAVFLTEVESVASACLLHHVARIHCLHETVVMLTIRTANVPVVDPEERFELEPEPEGFWRLVVRYGYMERPDVEALVRELAASKQLELVPPEVTYYLGRSTFLATERGRMGPLAEAAFAFLERNAYTADRYFGIPPSQVVELGNRIDL